MQLAPDRNSKIFMATQVADEARHLEVFLHRLRELGVTDPEAEIERRAQPALVEFKGALLELVAGGDWQAAVFAQNVILETMEYTVFRLHAANADAVTRDVLAGVIADERRHAGFGENDLGRSLAIDPSGRATAARDPIAARPDGARRVRRGALDDVGAPTDERRPPGRRVPRHGRTTGADLMTDVDVSAPEITSDTHPPALRTRGDGLQGGPQEVAEVLPLLAGPRLTRSHPTR